MNLNEIRRQASALSLKIKAAMAAGQPDATDVTALEGLQLQIKAAQLTEGAQEVRQHADRTGRNIASDVMVAKIIAEGNRMPIADAVEKAFGQDDLVQKAAAAAQVSLSNQAGNASELVAPSFYAGLVDLLKGNSVWAALNMTRVDLSGGALSVPYRDVPKFSGAWRAEGAPIPVAAGKFGLKVVDQKLAGTIVAMSREAITRVNLINLQAVVQGAIASDLAEMLDVALLSADAATATAPGGLLHGLTASKLGTTGNDIEEQIVDALLAPMISANLNDGIAFAINPVTVLKLSRMRTANGAQYFPELPASLMGYPVVSSTYVKAGDIIPVHAPSIFAGVTGVEMAVSQDASIALDPAKPNELVSLFQNNMVGIRATLGAGWAPVRAGAVGFGTIVAKA